MRDYDRLTPAERRDRDIAREQMKASRILIERPLSRQCAICKGTNFHGSCDGTEWVLDRFAESRSYVRKCTDCGNVERATREGLAEAAARDPKQTETSQGCAEEAIHSSETK